MKQWQEIAIGPRWLIALQKLVLPNHRATPLRQRKPCFSQKRCQGEHRADHLKEIILACNTTPLAELHCIVKTSYQSPQILTNHLMLVAHRCNRSLWLGNYLIHYLQSLLPILSIRIHIPRHPTPGSRKDLIQRGLRRNAKTELRNLRYSLLENDGCQGRRPRVDNLVHLRPEKTLPCSLLQRIYAQHRMRGKIRLYRRRNRQNLPRKKLNLHHHRLLSRLFVLQIRHRSKRRLFHHHLSPYLCGFLPRQSQFSR